MRFPLRRPWLVVLAILLVAGTGVAITATGRSTTGKPQASTTATVPAATPQPNPRAYPGGALDRDCSHVDGGLGGPGYQFIASCAGRSASPDRRWAVVRRGGEAGEDGGSVTLTDAGGRELDELSALSDAMPFVLYWSPRSDWFFVNHYLGSSLDRLRVFQIVNRNAIERSSVFAEATRVMVARYPCLGRTARVDASGWRWSHDGRRIALVAYSRPDACLVMRPGGAWVQRGDWDVLWMIGDVETGRIDPASVRVRVNGVGPLPTDGPYATL